MMHSPHTSTHNPTTIQWQRVLRGPTVLLAIIWLIHLFQVITGIELSAFGIYPRDISGLRGIALAPLIHADFQHLFSNSVPLFLLTTTLIAFYPKAGWGAFWLIYLLTGMGVWLFARSVYHIGASGVVYGLVAFIFWSGVFRRNFKTIVLALAVTLLYSGYIVGILPNQEGISWESHLLGGISGIFTAWWYRAVVEEDEQPKSKLDEDAPAQKRYFLPRDVFDKPDESTDSWYSNHS